MKTYLCANCGTLLTVTFKALPSIQKIVRLVSYHECGETKTLDELGILPAQVVPEDKKKFVQNLNDLHAPPKVLLEDIIGDRRPKEQVKSTAPESMQSMLSSVADQIDGED